MIADWYRCNLTKDHITVYVLKGRNEFYVSLKHDSVIDLSFLIKTDVYQTTQLYYLRWEDVYIIKN